MLLLAAMLACEADLVTLTCTGQVVTVSGTPFGLDDTSRDGAVVGSFTWDLGAPDGDTDPARGIYDHDGNSDFVVSVGDREIAGSGSAQVEVQDYDGDTFRFVDGNQVTDPPARTMTVDGEAEEEVGLWVSIVYEDVFDSDALPESLPTWSPDIPHTFSITDPDGTLLLQLDTLGP